MANWICRCVDYQGVGGPCIRSGTIHTKWRVGAHTYAVCGFTSPLSGEEGLKLMGRCMDWRKYGLGLVCMWWGMIRLGPRSQWDGIG